MRKTGVLREKPSQQGREPTINYTHMWRMRSCRRALSPLHFCVSRFWFLREFRFPWFQYFTLIFLSNKLRELLFSPRRLQGWCVCVNSRHLKLWQLLWQGASWFRLGKSSWPWLSISSRLGTRTVVDDNNIISLLRPQLPRSERSYPELPVDG